MRVLWVSQRLVDDGALSSTDLVEGSNHLRRFGHRVRMIRLVHRLHSDSAWWCDELVNIKLWWESKRLYWPLFLLQLIIRFPVQLLRYRPYIVIMDHKSVPGTVVFALLHRLGLLRTTKYVLDVRSCPLYQNVSGLTLLWTKAQWKIGVGLAKWSFDGFTTITSRMAQRLTCEFGIPPARIGVWGSGVAIDRFDPDTVVQVPLRESLGWGDEFVAVYHGVLAPHRGIEALVEAVYMLRRQGFPIRLLLLGKGPLEQSLRKQIENGNPEGGEIVHLHPAVPYTQVPSYISVADIGVFACEIGIEQWTAQSPLKVLEYLALGMPVVLTDIPAHRQVLGEGPMPCGEWVTSNSPEAIAQAILRLYERRGDLGEIGARGRALVLENFSWEAQVRRLESYLFRILDQDTAHLA